MNFTVNRNDNLEYWVVTKMKSEMRFDVSEVLLDDEMKLFSINYIKNAF